jgi:penicillin amidase
MATWTPTTTDAPAPPRTRRRILPRIALALLLLLLGAVAYLYYVARSALPQLDGTLTVPGLSAPVTVKRDARGVPTIEAQTLEDLFYAQGYVTAQDRLWEMDVMRRFAAGEMSEILGPSLLEHDREQRILGLRSAAQNAVSQLSDRDRSYFEAYARGVTAYLASHLNRLPIEFRLIGYQPKPWKVEDSLLLGARMVQNLNHGTYKSALVREKILARLGPELTADLFVNTSWRDRPPSGASRRIDDETSPSRNQNDDDDDEMDSGADSNIARLGSAVPQIPGAAPQVRGRSLAANLGFTLQLSNTIPRPELIPGSNNWVISGEHTVTGRPLLSNDMHLDHQMPNLWYEAHLHSGDYDVVGVTLPGSPFVIVGHNRRVAWGFTNVGPTVEDLYIENFNQQDAYETPKGWQAAQHRMEVIHVKGERDVTVDVVLTRHGPIITDLIPGETRRIALRWTLYDSLRNPFFDVNSAQNWTEFLKAFSELPAPGQNVVYADVDGHIGYHATGHVPIRAAGDGSLPVSGADDQHEWKGYIPFDKLPSVYDPPSGILATANSRISPDKYPYSISTEWDPPWRTNRIYQVLESGRKFSAADMLSLQNDLYSAFDRFCAERFVYALDHAKNLSQRAQIARDLLRDWDGRLTANSAAATIENRAQYELRRLLLEPKLGPAPKAGSSQGAQPKPEKVPTGTTDTFSWKSYRWFSSSIWLENVLSKQPQRWLPEGYPNYEALLAAAVESAVAEHDAPKDLTQWRWGAFAPIDIEHPVLGRLPLIGGWTAPGLHDQSGGGLTIKQVGRTFGPSERYTADLADFDQSTLNLVTGQSGNFLSPHYMDQWKAWYDGTTFTLPFSREAVERGKVHELVLQPGK